eukprot:comp11583_c0_seq1/m.6060 comp11583_c0_seq1/g.6060  ORF comp11583_c0_seq1/g.6060 comp11583_c0_seq1/m.6060 type:complete len:136 (-) comp11583_c0_seq1:531-938(-)
MAQVTSSAAMIKPRALGNVLKQANTGGVFNTLLLSPEGSLVAYSGDQTGDKDAKVTAAIAFHIWQAYYANAPPSVRGDGPNYVLVDCEEGKVVVTRVSKLLLCLYADKTVNGGMLKAKAQTIAKFLEEPLKSVVL